MSGGRQLASVWQHVALGNHRGRPPTVHQTAVTFFCFLNLVHICTKSPCDLVEWFSLRVPRNRYRAISHASNQSVAARRPSELDRGQTQSRTFLVCTLNITFDGLDDPSRPYDRKAPTKAQVSASIQTPPAQSHPLAYCNADQNPTSPVSVHNGIPTPWLMTFPRLPSFNIPLISYRFSPRLINPVELYVFWPIIPRVSYSLTCIVWITFQLVLLVRPS